MSNPLKIFIGSSSEGENIMTALTRVMRKHFGDKTRFQLDYDVEIIPWNDPANWEQNKSIFDNILNLANECQFATLIWTADDATQKREKPVFSPRDNVMYETGLFIGKLGKKRTFVIHSNNEMTEIPSDWDGIIVERFDGKKDDSVEQLEKNLLKVSSRLVANIEKELKNQPSLFGNLDNPLLKSVVKNAQNELSQGLKSYPDSSKFPASQYPFHLISLQKQYKNNITVKAIALVDQQEKFWQSKYSDEILDSIEEGSKSKRVFAFLREEDFISYYDKIAAHKQKYNVRVINADKLIQFGEYKKDFSIIELQDKYMPHKMMAEYNSEKNFHDILFDTDSERIEKHDEIFEKIWAVSTDLDYKKSKEETAKFLFTRLYSYIHKPIEMSGYIDIDEYDKYELDHPYFIDMMDKMIDIFDSHQQGEKWSGKVLEFGAGTGHFTLRLAERCAEIGLDIEIHAIEIDWHCYNQFQTKIKDRKIKNIIVEQEDSRYFDPQGKFKYIFSSFSDHHIKYGDKSHYFDNVRRNLEEGGRFIVGDEFLPAHDRMDKNGRKKALESYHNFIIEKAKSAGKYEVAHLEELALISGIEEKGDFKLSCEQYKKYLIASNLHIAKDVLISPKEKEEEIGGIYVYEILAD